MLRRPWRTRPVWGPGSDERGVTAVELLIGVLLLTIALVGLAASFPMSMYGVMEGGMQTTATALAQQAIDDTRRIPYSSLASAARAPVTGFDSFEREVVVADYTPATGCTIGGTASCKQVTVRVYFTGQLGEVVSTLTTVIAQP